MFNLKSQIKIALILVFAPFAVIGTERSAQAQTSTESQETEAKEETSSLQNQYRKLIELNKAKNLARQAAEKANGGLSEYRAEPAMHGPGQSTNYQEVADGVWKFRFQGKRPSADRYTIESVVVVDLNTDTVTVEYNGPIR